MAQKIDLLVYSILGRRACEATAAKMLVNLADALFAQSSHSILLFA